MKSITVNKKMVKILLAMFFVMLWNCGITSMAKTSGISLNKTSVTLYVNDSVTLKTTTKSHVKVTWSTSNKKIVTVKNGKVTAKSTGKAVVNAKANGKTAKCTISVVLSKKKQHQLYESTISSYAKSMKKGAKKWNESTNLETYFAFADIDKNGIDELIVRAESSYATEHTTASSSGYGENTNIYTISNNKVKKVFGKSTYASSIGHNNYVRIYKNCKYIDRGFSHLPHDYIFYKFNNGVLSSKPTYTFAVGDIYNYNEKSVSREYCMKQLRKVAGDLEGYQMYKYSASTYRYYI